MTRVCIDRLIVEILAYVKILFQLVEFYFLIVVDNLTTKESIETSRCRLIVIGRCWSIERC